MAAPGIALTSNRVMAIEGMDLFRNDRFSEHGGQFLLQQISPYSNTPE